MTVLGLQRFREADKARWPMLACAEDQTQLNIQLKLPKMLQKPVPLLTSDWITSHTRQSLHETVVKRAEQAGGLLRGAECNLCLYLQREQRREDPRGCASGTFGGRTGSGDRGRRSVQPGHRQPRTGAAAGLKPRAEHTYAPEPPRFSARRNDAY